VATDPRFQALAARIAHEATLMRTIREDFVQRDTEDWCRRLQAAEILHARIRSYDEVLADPVLVAQCTFEWIDQPGVAGALPMPVIPGDGLEAATGRVAPGVGSHSRDALAAMGFTVPTTPCVVPAL
jgi:crotonobetainyl-CoA:carnitine CoA-transferase CaiB-like acyl-CoA transferase